ncbi:hypothetical protein DITRI_Ditri02bG0183100 [Diplodiscus trichospermus]
MDAAAEASDGFSEWEQILAPTRPSPTLTPSVEQNMVVAQDNNNSQHQHDMSAFPPSRHEGLEITSDEEEVHVRDELEVNSSVASRSISSGDEANCGAVKKANEIGKILANGIVKVAARVRCFMEFGWGFWSVGAVSGAVAALLVSFVYAKARRWRARVKEEKEAALIFLIQEKKQKINQLLVQIAHMNELLSARRRVPVLRVS